MSSLFPRIPDIVPAGRHDNAAVEHFEVSEHDSRWSGLRGEYVPAGRYARLFVNGSLYMSDTAMERRTNTDVVRRANGHVLIAGLGLGLILAPILAKDSVTETVVIEKYQAVIDLVAPYYANPKLTIIRADIFEWAPVKGQKFDTVYFDIWPDLTTDNLKQINRLHQRGKHWVNYANPDHWMSSWCVDALRYAKRSGQWRLRL